MKRVIIITGSIFLVFLPIALLVFRYPMISTYLRRTFGIGGSTITSPQFAADSRTPEVTLTIVDTKYLEYVSAKLRIFDADAIVDPSLYRGNTSATKKHTVSRVEFVLVDNLESYVYGATGGKLFAAKGDYAVEGDRLKVSIALFPENIEDNVLGSTFPIERVFLKTAFVTLLYAHGLTSPKAVAQELETLKNDMKEYLEKSLFACPMESYSMKPV